MSLIRLGVVSAILAGCSSGAPTDSFGSAPITTITDGTLDVQVFGPSPLVRGMVPLKLVVTDTTGTPVDGLSVLMAPWMPAMGHGAPAPSVTGVGGGTYVASDIPMSMPGTWQLRTEITGPLCDSFVVVIQVE